VRQLGSPLNAQIQHGSHSSSHCHPNRCTGGATRPGEGAMSACRPGLIAEPSCTCRTQQVWAPCQCPHAAVGLLRRVSSPAHQGRAVACYDTVCLCAALQPQQSMQARAAPDTCAERHGRACMWVRHELQLLKLTLDADVQATACGAFTSHALCLRISSLTASAALLPGNAPRAACCAAAACGGSTPKRLVIRRGWAHTSHDQRRQLQNSQTSC
jgi:hypothetical protein